MKPIKIPAVNTTNPKLNGKYVFHNNFINWSYLILGNDARDHRKNRIKIEDFVKNQTALPPDRAPVGAKNHAIGAEGAHGDNHPPRKNIVIIQLINIIFEYSAKKNNAKDNDEYSTLNPETSSDSPSVKSNGALAVSAKLATINIIAAGNKGIINQTDF